ncbi:phage GP46 family protein [Ferrovibrio xuzhouensis]|uniref:Phage GP46 family protein n=1 Tax=Ferrovibrio xuzhouensis TaxID=1576914 RepID=A0ABV7VEQ4_9PROT
MDRLGLLFDLTALAGDIKVEVTGAGLTDRLREAVLISLFTWRQADPSDPLPDGDRRGWWGDSFPAVPGDRIGSRLWLLVREKIVPSTLVRARQYTEEALAWLVTDGLARSVFITVERIGIEAIGIGAEIEEIDGAVSRLDIQFPWEILNG